MYNFHEHYLVGEMDLDQAVQDCTLICTYDQLFELHCTQLTDTIAVLQAYLLTSS